VREIPSHGTCTWRTSALWDAYLNISVCNWPVGAQSIMQCPTWPHCTQPNSDSECTFDPIAPFRGCMQVYSLKCCDVQCMEWRGAATRCLPPLAFATHALATDCKCVNRSCRYHAVLHASNRHASSSVTPSGPVQLCATISLLSSAPTTSVRPHRGGWAHVNTGAYPHRFDDRLVHPRSSHAVTELHFNTQLTQALHQRNEQRP